MISILNQEFSDVNLYKYVFYDMFMIQAVISYYMFRKQYLDLSRL